MITAPRSVTESAGAGKIIHGDHALHAGHRQGFTGIDVQHFGVRVRAEQQLGEQHAFGAIILGVFRFAGDLGDQVRRGVVLPDQLRLVFAGGVLAVTNGWFAASAFGAFALGSVGLFAELDIFHSPREFGAAHERSENLVVILAPAEVARNAVREFRPRRIRIRFQKSNGGHDEAGHAERALKPLLFHDALLDGMKRAIGG